MDTTSRIFFIIVFFGCIWLILDQMYSQGRMGTWAAMIGRSIDGTAAAPVKPSTTTNSGSFGGR